MSKYSARRARRQTVNELTRAESDVILLLATGQAACGKEAARLMGRSVSTTLAYLSSAREKTETASTVHLVAWAWVSGMVARELVAARSEKVAV